MSKATKDKILEVSRKLFACKGFEGTSMREIAKEASVNLAAINYHFKSKLKLYEENFIRSYNEISSQVEALSNRHDKFDGLCPEVFDLFLSMSDELALNFKSFVLDSESFQGNFDDINVTGPPGGEYFLEIMKKQYPAVSENELSWGIEVLFSYMIHTALIMKAPFVRSKLLKQKFSKSSKSEDLRKLIGLLRFKFEQ